MRTARSVSFIGAVAAMTLGLGLAVAVSWFMFGGSASFRGPMRALETSWLPIYASQAVLAALVGAITAWRVARVVGIPRLLGAIGLAWLGEWLVLIVAGTALANELVPNVASFYWVIGTAGPLQPVAAAVGVGLWLLGRHRRGSLPDVDPPAASAPLGGERVVDR